MNQYKLRIKNLCKHGDNICEVTMICNTHFTCRDIKTGVYCGNSIQANFKPIPLTEEWLKKLGFRRNTLEANHNKLIYYSENNIAIKGMLGSVKPTFCKYVHQLQNLYFALTQKELTLKN